MVNYRWRTFENHQFAIATPYFGFAPTDQIEDAWDELLPKHPISISASRLHDLAQPGPADAPTWVRNPEDPDSILALPEYAVQLGCLNFLRQVGYRTSRDYTHLKAFQGGEDLVWERAYQCLERLRQAVMCWGDVGAITLYYDDHGKPNEMPGSESDRDVSFDFGTLHYCRNFDTLNHWTKRNGVQSVTMDNLWWGGSNNVV
ncbi:64a0ad20-e7e3-43d1-b9e2-d08983336c34 [Thermothielavioides terrestris]|nr:64a0ad20-e7e3-43d1-b9e2-d08983336c34 [Thermothielavioides terrestris]